MDKLYQELYKQLASISRWLETGHFVKDDQGNKLFRFDEVCRAVEEHRLAVLPDTDKTGLSISEVGGAMAFPQSYNVHKKRRGAEQAYLTYLAYGGKE